MSQVLSKEVKEVITARVRMLEGIKCDICGKIVPPHQYNGDMNRYFRVCTGHDDWGNDSWESREYKDICPGCTSKFVGEYLMDKKGYSSRYIEVRTEYCYGGEVRE